MNTTTKTRLNTFLIPKRLCHKYNWHLWWWKSRNHALISGRCVRCGMTGLEYRERNLQQNK